VSSLPSSVSVTSVVFCIWNVFSARRFCAFNGNATVVIHNQAVVHLVTNDVEFVNCKKNKLNVV